MRIATKRRAAVTLALALGAGWAQAADAPRGDTAAEATAAMERAQRLASNPMRAILEASKIRRKGDDEPQRAEPAAAAPRAIAAPAPATARSEPVAPAAPAAAPVAAVSPAEVLRGIPSRFTTPISAPVAALSTGARAPSLSALPTTAAPTAQLSEVTLQRPRLVSRIEPDFPPRLSDDVARLTRVDADLTLRPDGSVSAVALTTAVPRTLHQPIVAALEQWRFEPLARSRVHAVQLVINGDR